MTVTLHTVASFCAHTTEMLRDIPEDEVSEFVKRYGADLSLLRQVIDRVIAGPQ